MACRLGSRPLDLALTALRCRPFTAIVDDLTKGTQIIGRRNMLDKLCFNALKSRPVAADDILVRQCMEYVEYKQCTPCWLANKGIIQVVVAGASRSHTPRNVLVSVNITICDKIQNAH